ncbi:MAG TPA: ATP-binding cassette domain-containing protein [Balneolaceae bacterium]
MDEKILISCSKLSFSFGSEQVIDKLSFEAARGSHTVLKGESGSGKSTILKLLLGFLIPSAGTIEFNFPESGDTVRNHTAWLPQDLDLGEGTVEEIMKKPFEFSSNQSQKVTQGVMVGILQKLGLSRQSLKKQFRDLSTGQRQRVGLSICHLLGKPLLLLDEPTSALDVISKQKAADLLLNQNRTIISTSHDPFWVDLADNVIELN